MEHFHYELLKTFLRGLFAIGISGSAANMILQENNTTLIIGAWILTTIGAFGWWQKEKS